ncbi:hypothetical protein SAMN04489745_3113 [Arthrobacter woluwensis]|uniref:Uncharacterized protein n=2 Tax=Arthrobacter woluwensis TaxID=156980 RepID=A0A1H4TAE2_9MICC|nr:hypothetical protein SAMN04489745_0036 [Arthrobacter woluwensis]SEC53426.1 hypothetical protein SAMN04489745_3113 [Arthrobacter woluwensis]
MGNWIPVRAIYRDSTRPDMYFKFDGFTRERRDELLAELEQSGYIVQEILWNDPLFLLVQARLRKEMENHHDRA